MAIRASMSCSKSIGHGTLAVEPLLDVAGPPESSNAPAGLPEVCGEGGCRGEPLESSGADASSVPKNDPAAPPSSPPRDGLLPPPPVAHAAIEHVVTTIHARSWPRIWGMLRSGKVYSR